MPDSVVKPVPEVLARRMPGGAVLVHMATNRIFELNDTGARVWELLGDGLSREALVTRLVEEYRVDETRATAEVAAVIDLLDREGLIRNV